MLRCGLLGEKLKHSYSPEIHAQLGIYEYKIYEKQPEEVEDFILFGAYDGLNVTIPYKKTVLPLMNELSTAAERVGSVNTVVRRQDGSLYGDNTDVYGFSYLIKGLELCGKKVLVLGSGGASLSVCDVLNSLGAEVVVISRSGVNNYDNLSQHSGAEFIINTTPVGMYPKNGEKPLDIDTFPNLKAVVDLIYNPARTELLLTAEERGIECRGGLSMLVAQAVRSSELFTGESIPESEIPRITKKLSGAMQNLILIGMPGCGKTSIAQLLGKRLGRRVIDADEELIRRDGRTIPDIFEKSGENYFRKLESEVLKDLGAQSGLIIATGGGCVTRRENYKSLHQNGHIFWITRDTSKLEKDGRPLSKDLDKMYKEREPLYKSFADTEIDNNGTTEETVEQIVKELI